MKTFKEQAAQGDMLIRLIDKLPEGVKETPDENGNFVLAHSETGHNHVLKKQPGVEFYANGNDPFVAYVVVTTKAKKPCEIKHLRDYHTHETIALKKPDIEAKETKRVYEIRRQREYTPEGFRRAQD
jgi:hypothetical protein